MFKNFISILIILIHILAIIGIFIINDISIYTIIFQFIIFILSAISITGGYHRLWTHNSYKANTILEIFYLIFGTIASEGSVINWAKEHRTHHRNEEKQGDPYNISKGFFHAHIGWLLFPNDEIEKKELAKTDVSDLENNKLLLFQHNYYSIIWISLLILSFLIMIIWNESLINIIFSSIIRMVIVLNVTWCINSVAHTIGEKSHNTNIKASDNLILGILTMGEGWHNYHHSYPKDYRASESDKINFTTNFIDFTKKCNLSYNHYYKDINNTIPNNERFNTDFYKILNN